ncbi:MAG: hypothetical protein HY257_01140 [Chloroflexi bacterium]|nr:hypothetical protein [Chloroflexota bacterium]
MSSLLDSFFPHSQFYEFHSLTIHSSPARVWRALKELTPREVPVANLLFAIRALPARFIRGQIPRRFSNEPLLAQVTRASFSILAEEENREIVLGAIGQFWRAAGGAWVKPKSAEHFVAFNDASFAKAAMNFRLTALAENKTRLETETRIICTDDLARKKFWWYWRIISPGSALIRVVWLRAIKTRAEQVAE